MQREYQQIEKAINFIAEHQNRQPSLEEIASHVGISPHHFQRMFCHWAGVSPKRLLQYLTAAQAGELLRRRTSTLETSFEVGLSSSSRLHELFVTIHGMSPAAYRDHAADLHISWGDFPGPYGDTLIAFTDKGICWLSFHGDNDIEQGIHQMRAEWAGARFEYNMQKAQEAGANLFSHNQPGNPVTVHVKGSNFQIRVWEALLRIPTGSVATYSDISRRIGNPRASRAVGSAIGSNPVSWLIPCHRVIRSNGLIGGYRWGSMRKCMMLLQENPDSRFERLSA